MRYSPRRLGLSAANSGIRQHLPGRLREYHGVTTPLEQLILGSIKATGPISVANYMQLCLAHPTYGYYMKGDPLGVSGDFITSPEISQVFGELVATWFLSMLQSKANVASQRPNAKSKGVRLVELGPGRGTLMNDILRVLRGPLATSTPIRSVHLVETSATLRAKQGETLSAYSAATSHAPRMDIHWHEMIDDVPEDMDVDTLVIANEFFDALPIHIFEKAPDGWHEVLIDSQDSVGSNGRTGLLQPASHAVSPSSPSSRLRFVLSHSPVPVPAISTNSRFANLENGTRVEYSRASVSIMRKIAQLISTNKVSIEETVDSNRRNATYAGRGMALLVDYGAGHLFSSSFRGIRNHRIVDPFNEPGNSDLTSNVDFATLRDALGGFSNVFAHGPISQHDFLMKMGLEPRLAALSRGARQEQRRNELKAAGMKLVDTSPQGMGLKFQLMALTNEIEAPYPYA